jgi:hypothetical protein
VRIMLPGLRARRDPVSKTLTFQFGVRPSGPNGTWTGRDRAKNGLLGLLTTAICVGATIGAGQIEEHTTNLTTGNYIAFGTEFVFGFLALLAFVQSVIELVHAPFSKPWKVAP